MADAAGRAPGGPRPGPSPYTPQVTRDRRLPGDPHDLPAPGTQPRHLRPAEAFNAPPGRRGPARDAAARHAGAPSPAFDFATGKERPPQALPIDPDEGRGPQLPPPRSSPPPSAPPAHPLGGMGRTVALKGRRHPPAPGGGPSARAVPGGPGGAGQPASRPGAPGAQPAGRGADGRTGRPGPGTSRAREPHAPGAPRRLGVPTPSQVRFGVGGRPQVVDGDRVEAVRESWLIEDRWWTDRPLRRRYWEVVTEGGRDLVLFRDLLDGRWYRQR